MSILAHISPFSFDLNLSRFPAVGCMQFSVHSYVILVQKLLCHDGQGKQQWN